LVQQRDALVEYIKAERHYIRLQGTARAARKSGKEGWQERFQEASDRLESALLRIREVGVEQMLS
jgi:hypothetical protein